MARFGRPTRLFEGSAHWQHLLYKVLQLQRELRDSRFPPPRQWPRRDAQARTRKAHPPMLRLSFFLDFPPGRA